MPRLAPWLFAAGIIPAAAGALFAAGATPRQLLSDGHYRRARAAAEARLASAPDDAEALCVLSQLKLMGGDRDMALQLADRAVKADGKNPLAHVQRVKALVEAVDHSGGLAQIKLGGQLKSELQTVLTLDPANIDALKVQAAIYREAPAIFGGNKEKARELDGKIMQLDPVEGYFLQAELAAGEKQKSPVVELYRKAVEANPKSYPARIRLAYVCVVSSRKYDDAETHAREAIRINANRVDAYEILATVFAIQKKWDELEPLLDQAQNADPDNLRPYLNAAAQLVSRGVELPRAERYLQKYLSQEPELFAPDHGVAHWRLGQAFEKESRAAEALTEYQTAVRINPASPAKKDLDRLQSAGVTATNRQPAYEAAHYEELIRAITAGADSTERAQAIMRQLTKLRIPFESQPFEMAGKPGTNIIASLPAPSRGAPVLMLGAHLDRVEEGKGAMDNASGAAVVLELLARFKQIPLEKYRLVAAFWDREEDGLLGSQTFLASQPHDQLPSLYINFDMLGYGDTLLANWKDGDSKAAGAIRQAAANQLSLRSDFEFPPSDDRPFTAAGLEVIALALGDKQDIENGLKLIRGEQAPPPRILTIMHTAEDTPDKVRAADVCKALPVIERAIRLTAETR